MQKFTIDGKERVLDCNALTPFIYSEEFLTEGKNGKMRGEDINECVLRVMQSADVNDGIPPIVDMMRLWWTFERTADKATPAFNWWVKELPADVIDLTALYNEGSWGAAVMAELEASFFRSAFNSDVVPDEQ